MQAIEVTQLKKSFSQNFFSTKKTALDDLTFKVPKGEVTGFLGANGSGKTTTLKCLLDLIRPESGEILLFGKKPVEIIRENDMGFLPEKPYFYDYLTGLEVLNFYAKVSSANKSHLQSSLDVKNCVERALKKVGLYADKDRPLRTYSKGMLQRIGFAQATIHRPQLIVLDEPMSGLDPDGRQVMKEMIREAFVEGATVFLSSHLLSDVEELCSSLVVLSQGKSVFNGPIEDLLGLEQEGYKLYFRLRKSVRKSFSTHTGDNSVKDRIRSRDTDSNYKYEEESCLSLDSLNQRLDEIRALGGQIFQVRRERLSLEQAFNRIKGDL